MHIVCDTCEKNFTTDQLIIKEEQATINDRQYKRTYYLCPICKHKYIIQYDNSETLKLRHELIELIACVRKAIQGNGRPSMMLEEKIILKRKVLKQRLNALNNAFKRYV